MTLYDGHIIEVTVSGGANGQTVANAIAYFVDAGVVGATGGDVAEAWWLTVRSWWRSVCSDAYTDFFKQVLVKDLTDLTGLYGTYSIPLAEQGGTRVAPSYTDGLPRFIALGLRLNVPTRATRPGQKRLAGFHEADQSGGLFNATVLAAAQAWGDEAVETITLPAPALLGVLTPVVVRKQLDGSAGVYQNMTSASPNVLVTSQVSRKPGRGM